jgi:NRPS condensation-like uncharacterized protein
LNSTERLGVHELDTSRAVRDTLSLARAKGVTFWSENGKLHYSAPRGSLSPAELEKLRAFRTEIVASLRDYGSAAADEARLGPQRHSGRAPLTFSQLWYWSIFQLGKRPSLRGTSHASRLIGPLNVDALQRSFSEIVWHHQALRTRILLVEGAPEQRVDDAARFELSIDDLTSTSESERASRVMQIIEQEVTEPVNLAQGPLFSARLLQLRADEHVLIVAMDHMISDAFSLGLTLRDLFAAYAQILARDTVSFPTMGVQYADYAIWQSKEESSWLDRHGSYWRERLAICDMGRFPVDAVAQATGRCGVDTLPILIGRDLRKGLSHWCRQQGTTVAMAVLTAYVALLARWCNSSELAIQYQTNGRTSPKVLNTIGYFASLLCLRVELLDDDDDDFIRLLSRVTKECSDAYERTDCSYMATQISLGKFARNSIFNWIPEEPKIAAPDLNRSGHSITADPIEFLNPELRNLEWNNDPEILLFDHGETISGHLYFPTNRFSAAIMARFGRNIMVFVRALVEAPGQSIKDIALVK